MIVHESSTPLIRYCSYNKAVQIKEKQDEYCSRVLAGKWKDLGEFPDDFQWEALVDVVRGRVKVTLFTYICPPLDTHFET